MDKNSGGFIRPAFYRLIESDYRWRLFAGGPLFSTLFYFDVLSSRAGRLGLALNETGSCFTPINFAHEKTCP